jgi:hypothetical protein
MILRVFHIFSEFVDEALPHDYLHVLPNTSGYDKGAGIFKKL